MAISDALQERPLGLPCFFLLSQISLCIPAKIGDPFSLQQRLSLRNQRGFGISMPKNYYLFLTVLIAPLW